MSSWKMMFLFVCCYYCCCFSSSSSSSSSFVLGDFIPKNLAFIPTTTKTTVTNKNNNNNNNNKIVYFQTTLSATKESSSSSSSNSNKKTRIVPSTNPDDNEDAIAIAAEDALKRTISQLERFKRQERSLSIENDNNNNNKFSELYEEYLLLPANTLKFDLKKLKLPDRGRKPDLAKRLAEYNAGIYGLNDIDDYVVKEWNPEKEANKKNKKKTKTKQQEDDEDTTATTTNEIQSPPQKRITNNNNSFCGIVPLSDAARQALSKAKFFETPTPIQQAAIPSLYRNGESLILHAETGSGKTLAYLLPITEQLWYEYDELNIIDGEDIDEPIVAAGSDSDHDDDDNGTRANPRRRTAPGYGFILTPTRELAAQVAGVATVLAPPGTVRMVSKATNLKNDGLRDLGEQEEGGILDEADDYDEEYDENGNPIVVQQRRRKRRRSKPRLFIGSAKAIMHSLYGDGKMPASPTRKPHAKELLRNTRWIVLDEVDRLLLNSGNSGSKKGTPSIFTEGSSSSSGSTNSRRAAAAATRNRHHEKPAAVITSAVARLSLGRAQTIAASATVGRTLKRELSRVLGLEPKECPRVVRSENVKDNDDDNDDDDTNNQTTTGTTTGRHVGRAVTIPDTVQHYVTSSEDASSSVGKLLTHSFFVLRALKKSNDNNNSKKNKNRRILFVLTKRCGISTQNAIGALKHFGCLDPEPQSLLDVLQADGTKRMIEVHRRVSGATGIGESISSSSSSYFQNNDDNDNENDDNNNDNDDGYLLVTGEDTVRGLHLDGLDVVIIVGRPNGPDEYTHIAGRTGRAGRPGKVINVLSDVDASKLNGWEKMLSIQFQTIVDVNKDIAEWM